MYRKVRVIEDERNIARIMKVLAKYPRTCTGSLHVHEEIYRTRRGEAKAFFAIGGKLMPFEVEIWRFHDAG